MRSSVSSPEVEPAKHVRAEQPHAGHPDGTLEFPSAQSAALPPMPNRSPAMVTLVALPKLRGACRSKT